MCHHGGFHSSPKKICMFITCSVYLFVLYICNCIPLKVGVHCERKIIRLFELTSTLKLGRPVGFVHGLDRV